MPVKPDRLPTQSRGQTAMVAPLLAIVMMLSSAGCALRGGAKTVMRDRFDYAAVLTNSLKQQMLMNLVKLRYLDPPMFLDVAQVVTSYTFERSASINAPDWLGGQAGSAVGVSGSWAESPTITYNPMVGDTYFKSLLQPVPPTAIFSLVQAGWPVDGVFGVGVRTINGLEATSRVGPLKQRGDADFYLLLKLLRELQVSESFGVRVQQRDNTGEAVVVFSTRNLDAEDSAKLAAVKKLLGLNPDASEFDIAFGSVARSDREIAVATRSMLEILSEASAGVEVPLAELNEGRATTALPLSNDNSQWRFIIHAHSSPTRPEDRDTFTSVRYREKWFWVDDRDLTSKRGLSFLMTLFTLAEAGKAVTPPVLTISRPGR